MSRLVWLQIEDLPEVGGRQWKSTNSRYRLWENQATGNVFIYRDEIMLNARYDVPAAKRYAQADWADHRDRRPPGLPDRMPPRQ